MQKASTATVWYEDFSREFIDSRGADSVEKHEPASDIDTATVDSLKALDPKRPIREADVPNFSVRVEFLTTAVPRLAD